MRTYVVVGLLEPGFYGFIRENQYALVNNAGTLNHMSISEPTGIIGRYYEEEMPVIMVFENALPAEHIMSQLPLLSVISWKYDGSQNNGMPPEKVNTRMTELEDAIEEQILSEEKFTHAYNRTGNHLKEFVYYSKSQEDFLDILKATLSDDEEYPIEINFYHDENWDDFKKVIEDFID